MNLTQRQEKQLNKVFDNPKKLRKWIDDVYNDMVIDSFKEGYLSLEDCIKDLANNGVKFETIVNEENKIKWKNQ